MVTVHFNVAQHGVEVSSLFASDEVYSGKRTVFGCARSFEELSTVVHAAVEKLGVKLEDVIFMRSSSLDFPDEYTDDLEVLALVEQINNENEE